MNELQTIELPEYSIEYTHPEIAISNLDSLKETVDRIATQYRGLVVSEDTEKDAKDIKAKLNKLSKALDDRRKEIGKDYNKPFNAFKAEIDQLRSRLDDSIRPIDSALKELDAKQREERRVQVMATISEMAPNYEVHPEDIEIQDSWLNKSISKKKLLEEIAESMTRVKEVRDKLATDTNTITKYAEAKDIAPDGFVDQLVNGQEVDYLIQSIDNAAERKIKQQQAEEARVAEERTHQTKQGDSVVDTDTGEVVSREVTLAITATIPQMKLLKSYMDANGIGYKRAGV